MPSNHAALACHVQHAKVCHTQPRGCGASASSSRGACTTCEAEPRTSPRLSLACHVQYANCKGVSYATTTTACQDLNQHGHHGNLTHHGTHHVRIQNIMGMQWQHAGAAVLTYASSFTTTTPCTTAGLRAPLRAPLRAMRRGARCIANPQAKHTQTVQPLASLQPRSSNTLQRPHALAPSHRSFATKDVSLTARHGTERPE